MSDLAGTMEYHTTKKGSEGLRSNLQG